MTKLSQQSIEDLAHDWYRKLDVHAPMLEVVPMLSQDGDLEMRFPEATLRGLNEFERWYQGVIRVFFDEAHQVKEVESVIRDDGTADVKIVVHWEASRWTPPAEQSDRLEMDAFQTWNVKYSERAGGPVITRYVVDELRLSPGSATL